VLVFSALATWFPGLLKDAEDKIMMKAREKEIEKIFIASTNIHFTT